MHWSIRNNSLGTRLTAMNLLVSGTALLVACLAFVSYDLITFRQIIVRNLSSQAEIIGSSSAAALLFNDRQAAERILAALQDSQRIMSAQIFTAAGEPFATYRRDPAQPLGHMLPLAHGQHQAYRFEGREILLTRAILFDGKRIGAVVIYAELQDISSRFRQYLTIAGVVLLLSLGAALGVSSIFRRSVAKPMVKLAELARIISREKNFSVRAAAAPDGGEVGVLIEAFNEMLAQIESQNRALQEARNELEARVQQRTAELSAANKELEAFSYSVSHDLRAPLRSIDGFSQALMEDYGDSLDSKGADYLRRVRAATQRMSALIDDLLNLSRVTRSAIQRQNLDLSAIAQAIAQDLREREPERQVEFVIEEGATANGDARLLRVAMENLFGNAWKYTSRHPSARIEFGCHRDNGRPVYFVRDDGAGFDPAYASRLFGAFQRLHGINEFPGSGIGLATVQRIIHKHGGTIWAEGAVEKGATFYFTL